MAQRNYHNMKRRILVLCLLAALLLASAAAVAQARLETIDLVRAVGSSGFTSSSVDSVTLNGTLGQPFVGVRYSGNVKLGQGFWHGGEESTAIYLPLVKR